ncbi:hypothetical protein C8J56DRAFT_885596 [Mycena floridula]|nr:hypothetical protein C8J56DRAFT_885596 [Mycena floridula]
MGSSEFQRTPFDAQENAWYIPKIETPGMTSMRLRLSRIGECFRTVRHNSLTEEKAHPGDHVHPDWDTPLPVPGSLKAQIREKECEILDLMFDMNHQKQRISELEEYVTALEKAQDLLLEMRANYNSALDHIAHEQDRAE